MEGSAGGWTEMWRKPFAMWVVFGGLVYFGLAILALAVPFLVASPGSVSDPIVASTLIFVALFFVAAIVSLKGKRWTFALAAVVSLAFVGLFGSFLLPSLTNPADSTFWLAISGFPALVLVAVFSVFSLRHVKTGLLQKRYLATPNSAGGLLVVGVIGFVIGGLVAGSIGAGVILRNISAPSPDIEIVPGAAMAAMAYSPQTYIVAAGGTVTWLNRDTMSHTVTSNETGVFDSGLLTTGQTWSHVFMTPGTYSYRCTPHNQMWGVIIVS